MPAWPYQCLLIGFFSPSVYERECYVKSLLGAQVKERNPPGAVIASLSFKGTLIFICVCVCSYVYIYGGQRLTLGIILRIWSLLCGVCFQPKGSKAML